MSREYEKARQECAKKYNERIRELEQEVKALKAINKAQSEDLKNQSKLQRDFTKLCIFLKLSEKERNRILNNKVLNEAFSSIISQNRLLLSPAYSGLLSNIAIDMIKNGNIDSVVDNLLKDRRYDTLKHLYNERKD